MALIWRREVDGTTYEVRSAGRSRRLYTNGVFHSQYNPSRPWTHGVWDLLMFPALFYPPERIQRVLVLGVGGGAAIRLLQHHVGPKEIIGIDLNAVHISVARRFFGIDKRSVQLIEADAIHWLENYTGPAFDLIIDDLFGEVDGEPQRAIPLHAHWCRQLTRHLSSHGALVVNTMGNTDLHHSALLSSPQLEGAFLRAWRLELPLYDNAVGAFLRIDATRHTLYKALEKLPRSRGYRHDFRLRQVRLRAG